MKKQDVLVALALIGLGLLTRLVWHPANTTALMAIAVFAGFYFRTAWAWLLPLSIMLLSDIVLGGYELPVRLTVYGSIVVASCLGIFLKNKLSVGRLLSLGLLPATIFFLTTNLAVWAFTPWYEKTLVGLINCYYLALPFWRNMLVGDMLWLGVVFGSYALIFNRDLIFSWFKLWYTKAITY